MSILLAVVVSLVAGGSFVHAQYSGAVWNTFSNDLPLVESKNNTLYPNTNTNYSVTTSGVSAGQVVAVHLYFHNTGTTTANNARFTLTPQTTNSSTVHTFNATLRADNANAVSGQTTIYTTSTQTLTYVPGSVKFYRYNQGSNQSALINGQNGSELFSGGLNIGNIPGYTSCSSSNTFCEQGSVVVLFQVNQSAPTTYACNDGIDNDGDGYVDYPNDPGCFSSTDTDEYNYTPQNNYCTIDQFTASPNSVQSGAYTTLYWQTTGCSYVTIDGVNYPADGQGTFGPLYSSRNYQLIGYGGYTNPQSQAYVSVVQQQQPVYQYCSVDSFYPNLTTISSGQAVLLNWSTNGAYSATLSGPGISSQTVATSGYQYVYPTVSGTYTLTANCSYGYTTNNYRTTYINVNPTYVAPVQNIAVQTVLPTNVGYTTARINGVLTNSGSQNTTGYFEWGTSAALGNQTPTQNLGANTGTAFFDTLSGLSQNTYYYYRAVATNNLGTTRGDLMVIHTNQYVATPTTPTVPRETVTVVRGIGLGTNLVQLRVEGQNSTVCVADNATNRIYWKNISGRELTDVVLQISLSKDVTFRSSSNGIYNSEDKTVTLNLGRLAIDEEGQVFITTQVANSARDRSLVVMTATLSFENPLNSARETATAYGLSTSQVCADNSSLAGLALFGGTFFPTTLIGWLFLVLLILALIWIARLLYRPRTPAHAPHISDMDVPTAPYHH